MPHKAKAAVAQAPPHLDLTLDDQYVRDGGSEQGLVRWQAAKDEEEQDDIATYLPSTSGAVTAEVCVVGCGPAGLRLAALLAERGLTVCLMGPEAKFTNNYGVWVDEFSALGFGHLLDHTWSETVCYFADQEKRLARAYGRVHRSALRHNLLSACQAHGITYVPQLAAAIDAEADAQTCRVIGDGGATVTARLVTLAGGAVSAKFLAFEAGAPPVASQSAYGVVAEVDGYGDAYDPDAMLFMDYRRAHSGMWDDTGFVLRRDGRAGAVTHPNWDPNHGAAGEPPSFLYGMPLRDGTVFLEETCLVARPLLPFAALKRRLYRRCAAMGIQIRKVLDEEYSYIPVGGPMPRGDQRVTAFGAAANLVHPATGYSITRMLEESAPFADAVAGALERGERPVGRVAGDVWGALWPLEKRRQAAFHTFGMELLATLEVSSIHHFFETFFRLPDKYWRGFLGSRLTSAELMAFALLTFVTCSNTTRAELMRHLLLNPSGAYLVRTYIAGLGGGSEGDT